MRTISGLCAAGLVAMVVVRTAWGANAVMNLPGNQPEVSIQGVTGYFPWYLSNTDLKFGSLLPPLTLPPRAIGFAPVVTADHDHFFVLTDSSTAGGYHGDQLSIFTYNSATPLRTVSLATAANSIATLNGTVYAATIDGRVLTIDPLTGAETALGTIGIPPGSYPPANWYLHANPAIGLLGVGSLVGTFISTMDPATGVTRHVAQTTGVAFDAARLSVASNGQFAQVGSPLGYAQLALDLSNDSVSDALPKSQTVPSDVMLLPSDAFDFPYSASLPALVQFTLSADTVQPSFTRSPSVLHFTMQASITNYAVPDQTTVTNLQFNSVLTASGPLGPATPGLTVVRQFMPMPTLGLGVLETDTVTIDLAQAPRGAYSFGITPSVTADYTTGGVTTRKPLGGPAINFAPGTQIGFYYDPISSNLIGNGDFQFFNAGWTGDGQVIYDNSGTNLVLLMIVNGVAQSESQTLDLPLAGGPMLFRGRFSSSASTSVAVTLSINGRDFAQFQVPGGNTMVDLSANIEDPDLFGLTHAVFALRADPGPGAYGLYADNFSLTAVPEPAVMVTMLLAAPMALLGRRRASRQMIAAGEERLQAGHAFARTAKTFTLAAYWFTS